MYCCSVISDVCQVGQNGTWREATGKAFTHRGGFTNWGEFV